MNALSPVILSADNPVLKSLMALQSARGIRRQGRCLAAGAKLLAELAGAPASRPLAWILTPGLRPPPGRPGPAPSIVLSPERFHAVNIFGTPGPLAVVPAPELPAFDPQAPWPDGMTLFLPFSDPENVGGAIRAAAGLGAARVVLLREAACPYLPKAVRSSAGTLWKIRLEQGPALARLEAPAEHPLWALDMGGTPLDRLRPPAVLGLVAGQEGQGLPEPLKARCRRVSIPMANGVESLNAAASVAVALWAWRRPAGP